jgi:tetratricopeptide (TPR) repeat protein
MEHPQDNLLTRIGLVSGFCAVLIIPLMAYGCGPEWARWDAAQAVMAYEQGDVEGAIDQLTAAVEKSPRDPSLKLSLAQKLIESNQPFQAERVCDEILKRFPDNDRALVSKANSQQAQGNFEKGLETFNRRAKARSWLISDSYLKLNERAYYRALAGVELGSAKDDIDLAIQRIVKLSRFGETNHPVSLLARSLIASALIGRQIGMTEAAAQRMTPLIDRLRATADASNAELNRNIIEQSTRQFPPPAEVSKSNNNLRSTIRTHEKTLALLLTTRALCHQDLEMIDLSNQDRAEVRSLVLDADELLASLPADNTCLAQLSVSVSLLDTRGFIVSQLPEEEFENIGSRKKPIAFASNLASALVDLNQAIFAHEIFAQSLGSKVHNHMENLIDLNTAKLEIPKMKAVLRYHRMLLLEKMGDQETADQDRAKIRRLGFEPGQHLF